jgi:hypothetical protein
MISMNRKSALLKQINKPISEVNGCVIDCKFDQTATHQDSALASTFDTFFGRVVESSDVSFRTNLKVCIQSELGERAM